RAEDQRFALSLPLVEQVGVVERLARGFVLERPQNAVLAAVRARGRGQQVNAGGARLVERTQGEGTETRFVLGFHARFHLPGNGNMNVALRRVGEWHTRRPGWGKDRLSLGMADPVEIGVRGRFCVGAVAMENGAVREGN